MATTNLFTLPGLQGRRVHGERPARARLRPAEDDGRDRPGRRAGRADLRLLGRARGRRGAGREGTGSDALERFREALNFLCEYASDQGYDMRFALEPKPNEPRGDLFLPTVGHALHLIATLDHPEMVGVNPEVAHETMAGLNFNHAVAPGAGGRQAVPRRPERAADRPLRPGLPLRPGGPQGRVLPGQAARGRGLRGPAPLRRPRRCRTEDEAGVWDFAAGCMRTYLILAEKARQFAEDPEIQAALARPGRPSSPAVRRRRTRAPRSSGCERGDLRPRRPGRAGVPQRPARPAVTDLLLGVR